MASTTPHDSERARILIVDDSAFDRERLRDSIAGLGEIEVHADAEAALSAMASGGREVDLVISDVVMPGLSGTQLLERVRLSHPGTDLVLITGDASVDTAVAALRMGAVDYLLKPIQEEQLRRVVEQVLLRRRLSAENRKLSRSLRTVDACRALAPCLDPAEVHPLTLDLVMGTLGRTRGLALFHRASVPQGDAIAFRGFSEAQAGALRHMLIDQKRVDLDSFVRVGIFSGGPISDALSEAGVECDRLLAVPVRGQAGELGVLWVMEDGDPSDNDDLELVHIVRKHAEAALSNAERYSDAQERAFIDDVTEVYNARYLLSAAENEIRRAKRYRNPLSLIFLDIDRFKLVNDNHGHLVGSQTLRNLSQLLLQSIRQVDTLARYGGDEFTILLPDSDHEAALRVAERIRKSVEEQLFEAGANGPLRLTLSLGVSSFPAHGADRSQLLDAADKAMYRAKSLGRNRVCSANELPGNEPTPPL